MDAEGYWAPRYEEVYVQFVPAHIGHPAEYPDGDPCADFLPPPVADAYGDIPRAAVICDRFTTAAGKDIQRYRDPVMILSGAEYAAATFDDLLDRITTAVNERERVRKDVGL